VKSAVGFSDTRGDQVQVANLQFADRPELAAQGTSEPGLFDFTRDDLMNGAEMAVTLLIALALVFFVLRPLLKRVLAPEGKALALPASAELGGGPVHHGSGDFGSNAIVSTLPNLNGAYVEEDEQPRKARVPAWMNSARAMGETQANTLKTVGELVDENPKQAALIVRDWLASAT
jgi:flagellar M-ring protein FliF